MAALTPASRTPRGFSLGTSLDWIPKALGNPNPPSQTPNEVDNRNGSVTCNGVKKQVCDACDGDHLTSQCPYFSKPRDEHPDAIARGLGKFGLSSSAGNFVLKCKSSVRWVNANFVCLLTPVVHSCQDSQAARRRYMLIPCISFWAASTSHFGDEFEVK
jgi:hypothetical protein